MYNFGSYDAFIVKPTIMPDFARNLLHHLSLLSLRCLTTYHVGRDIIPFSTQKHIVYTYKIRNGVNLFHNKMNDNFKC